MRGYKYHEDTDCLFQVKPVDDVGQIYMADNPDTSYDRLKCALHFMPHQQKIETVIDYIRGDDPYSMPNELDFQMSMGSSYYGIGMAPLDIALPEWED